MAFNLNLASGGLLGITNLTIQKVSSNVTLSAVEGDSTVANRVVIIEAGATETTLPAPADLESGQIIRFKNLAGTGSVININGSEVDGESNNITILDGQSFDLITDGSVWFRFD